jgi:hypothetical protein
MHLTFKDILGSFFYRFYTRFRAMDLGIIIGIVIGVVVFFLCLLLVGLLIAKNRAQPPLQRGQPPPLQRGQPPPHSSVNDWGFDYQGVAIPTKSDKFGQYLSDGSFELNPSGPVGPTRYFDKYGVSLDIRMPDQTTIRYSMTDGLNNQLEISDAKHSYSTWVWPFDWKGPSAIPPDNVEKSNNILSQETEYDLKRRNRLDE